MAVTRIGSATGTTTVAIPAHQIGDLIVIFAYRDGFQSAPTIPSGWTDAVNGQGNTNGARVGYRIATATNTTSGTWTSATSVIAVVYRGAAIGNVSASATGSSAVVTFPACALTPDVGSWFVGFTGHRTPTTTGIATPPTGMTNITSVTDTTDRAAAHDTNGIYSTSWAAATASVGGTASGWMGLTIELIDNQFIRGTTSATFSASIIPDLPGYMASVALALGDRWSTFAASVPSSGGTGTSFYPLDISADGTKIITGTISGFSFNQGLARSIDAGASWQYITGSGSGTWTHATVSDDGTIMTASREGGGIVYSNNSGASVTSSNAPALLWTGLWASGNGMYQVACYSGTTLMYESSDYGVTWSTNGTAGTADWANGLYISDDGSFRAAVRFNNTVITSNDYGVTWTARAASGSRPWGHITGNRDASILLAANRNQSGSGGYIYRSTDYGATWTELTNSGLRPWLYIAVSEDGQKIFGTTSSGPECHSLDAGVTWTSSEAPYPRHVRMPAAADRVYYTTSVDMRITTPLDTPAKAEFTTGGMLVDAAAVTINYLNLTVSSTVLLANIKAPRITEVAMSASATSKIQKANLVKSATEASSSSISKKPFLNRLATSISVGFKQFFVSKSTIAIPVSIANMFKSSTKTFFATSTAIATNTRELILGVIRLTLTATSISSSSLIKFTRRIMLGVSTSVGTNLKRPAKVLNSQTSSASMINKSFPARISAVASSTPSLIKKGAKTTIAISSSIGSLIKKTSVSILNGVASNVSSIVKSPRKIVSALSTSIASVLKRYPVTITAISTSSSNVIKNARKIISAVATNIASLNALKVLIFVIQSAVVNNLTSFRKFVGKRVSSTTTSVGTFSVIKSLFRSLTASVASTPIMVKASRIVKSASVSSIAKFNQFRSYILSVIVGSNESLIKSASINLTKTVTSISNVVKSTRKMISVSSNAIASRTIEVTKTIVAIPSSIGNIFKSVSVEIATAQSISIGDFKLRLPNAIVEVFKIISNQFFLKEVEENLLRMSLEQEEHEVVEKIKTTVRLRQILKTIWKRP